MMKLLIALMMTLSASAFAVCTTTDGTTAFSITKVTPLTAEISQINVEVTQNFSAYQVNNIYLVKSADMPGPVIAGEVKAGPMIMAIFADDKVNTGLVAFYTDVNQAPDELELTDFKPFVCQ